MTFKSPAPEHRNLSDEATTSAIQNTNHTNHTNQKKITSAALTDTLTKLFNKRLFFVLILGFSSGLPLALVGGSLQAWYTTAGVDIVTIGTLALVGQPYAFKFLWSPIIDRYTLPFLGRRRDWMFVCQASLLLIILGLSFMHPGEHPLLMAGVALVTAFLAASQDIAIDAYRTDLLDADERGMGAALAVAGYRVAMITSGGIALILADLIGWHKTYMIMGFLMLIGMIASLYAPDPEYREAPPVSLRAAVVEPFLEFLTRKNAVMILVFIVLYKLSEAFSTTTGPLTTTFLLRGIGFSLTTVGTVNKGIGLFASILGTFVGGFMMLRINIYRALMNFGIFQAIANSSFVLLALVGKNHLVLVGAVFIDNLSYGMGTTAIVAFIMSLCDKRYSATQFALLSSLAAVSRVFIGPLGGLMVEHAGWVHFFVTSVVVTFPALYLLWWLNARGSIVEHTKLPAP